MLITLVSQCRSFLSSRRNLKAAWLIMAGILAFYVALPVYNLPLGINNSKASGLAEARPEPIGLWRAGWPLWKMGASRSVDHAYFETAPNYSTAALTLARSSEESFQDEDKSTQRKMVRTSSMDVVVAKPAEAAENIRSMAEKLGGFLVSSQISGGPEATVGSLTIRVPAERFEQARVEIRKISLRIDGDRLEAQDVTRDYVDRAASLRNLRAEEQQFLLILKQSRTVKDTLDVSEKLSDVRGKIDQQQAEFEALSKQIETVAINITLRSDKEARVFGLDWRPLYQIKLAMRQGLDGLADYASTMAGLLFLLPTILLWLVTIVVGAAAGWRLLRWLARHLFRWKPAEKPATA